MTAEAQAAKRGAKLLDTFVPNWFRKVKPSELQLSNPDQCVLGQVHGEFFAGLKELTETAINQSLVKSLKAVRTYDGGSLGTALTNAVNDAGVTLDEYYYGFNSLYYISDYGSKATSQNASFELLGQQWLREIAKRRTK